jgi:hypothetical protein
MIHHHYAVTTIIQFHFHHIDSHELSMHEYDHWHLAKLENLEITDDRITELQIQRIGPEESPTRNLEIFRQRMTDI